MILSYVLKRLSAGLNAGILNRAFIEREIIKNNFGSEFIDFFINNAVCSIFDSWRWIQIDHVIHFDPANDANVAKKIFEHADDSIMRSKYVGLTPNDSCLHSFTHIGFQGMWLYSLLLAMPG